MISFRDRTTRGRTNAGWLDSRHSFSFAGYHDPRQMGFRALRVINEDKVAPGAGFPAHSHRDMEIVTYVLAGALAHRDSLGNSSVIAAGDVQRMSAGTGITHSEFNSSGKEPVHFLQIWIIPNRTGLVPGYEQKAFPAAARMGSWRLVAARDGQDGAITLHQDARLSLANLVAGDRLDHAVAQGRGLWLQILSGIVTLNGGELREGDGAAIEREPALQITATTDAELLLFDLGAF